MKILNSISEKLNTVVTYLCCIFMFLLVISCFLQVFTRYVLNNSLSWTEEMARAVFVWASMLGLSIATKKWTNPTIDVLSGMLHGKAKLIHKGICEVGIIVLCVILGYWGVYILPALSRSVTAAMRLPNSYLYASIPVASIVIIVHCVNDVVNIAVSLAHGGEERGGEDVGV